MSATSITSIIRVPYTCIFLQYASVFRSARGKWMFEKIKRERRYKEERETERETEIYRFRNPHTSRTRKRSEQAVQFLGTVKLERTPPIPPRSISYPYRGLPFPYLYELAEPPSSGEMRASNRYPEPESFADRSRVRAEPLSFNPLLPLTPFIRPLACDPSHSSSSAALYLRHTSRRSSCSTIRKYTFTLSLTGIALASRTASAFCHFPASSFSRNSSVSTSCRFLPRTFGCSVRKTRILSISGQDASFSYFCLFITDILCLSSFHCILYARYRNFFERKIPSTYVPSK